MEKDDLIKYKEKLSKLSDNEKKLRELYLKNLLLGNIQGPLTGYSSIDIPNLKYSRETPIKKLDGIETIYDMIFKNQDMGSNAIGFLDGKCNWSFKKLKEETDKCISFLNQNGIKEGDNVLFGVTNTPEMIAALIAFVSVGATVKFFDIRANENDIAHYAVSSNCKYMVCLDKVVLPKVKNILDLTDIQQVFVLRPGNSLSLLEKLKYVYENRNEIFNKENEKIPLPNRKQYSELTKKIQSGKLKNFALCKYNPDRPAIKVQSSGTTGKAKTIVHTEKSAVEFAKSISHTDLPLGKGKSVLVALPPWIAYGIGDAVLMSLALGSEVMLCADFEPNAVFRNIGNFTLSYAAPFHYRFLREHYNELSNSQKAFLREHVDCMITGGDKYAANENEADEKLFGTKVLNGYGNNEDWGALSVNPMSNNKYGTVGLPKYGETTIVVDDDNNEVPYGVEGEICTLSNTRFMNYENNQEATNKTLQKHSDGKIYLHTGDQGFIDNEGYIHLSGRKERVIIRLGFKLSAYTIEDAITSLPYINECIAVEVPDSEEEHVPMVYVVPSKDCNYTDKEIISKLMIDCHSKLKENEIPKYIKIVPELKYTDNNKYDFRYYEEQGKQFVRDFINNTQNQGSIKKK